MRGIIVLIILSTSSQALAHPVTYKDAWMIQSMFREKMSQNSLIYSFHRNFGLGFEATRFELTPDEPVWALADFNVLVKKWNLPGAQGNLYLMSGAGATIKDNSEEFAGKAGFEADYETRKFYTLFQYIKYWSEQEDFDWYQYRIGFAPYLVGYDGLHTWAILQLDYNEATHENVQVTPLLRFFYKNVLWEMGGSFKGNIFFQFMVHI